MQQKSPSKTTSAPTPQDVAKASAKDAKAAAKKKSRKGLRDASDPNLHKRLASDRISADVADFEKSGGRVEKLGVTKVLLKIPLV
jgi:hypothetical protein